MLSQQGRECTNRQKTRRRKDKETNKKITAACIIWKQAAVFQSHQRVTRTLSINIYSYVKRYSSS